MSETWQRGDYTISTDPQRLDVEVIHTFLSQQSYWARGRSREIVERSLKHSLNFGVFGGEKQIGFARVVSDHATFAWIGDVFILPEHRGKGLSKWLLDVIMSHPELQGLRRWMLATKDAHGLYRQFGFQELFEASRWMEKFDQNA